MLTQGHLVEVAGFGVQTIILPVSSLLKFLSFLPYHKECSGLLKGSQMYNPIGRGLVQGGVFKVIGLMVEEQDEWTAVITEQVSAT